MFVYLLSFCPVDLQQTCFTDQCDDCVWMWSIKVCPSGVLVPSRTQLNYHNLTKRFESASDSDCVITYIFCLSKYCTDKSFVTFRMIYVYCYALSSNCLYATRQLECSNQSNSSTGQVQRDMSVRQVPVFSIEHIELITYILDYLDSQEQILRN